MRATSAGTMLLNIFTVDVSKLHTPLPLFAPIGAGAKASQGEGTNNANTTDLDIPRKSGIEKSRPGWDDSVFLQCRV